MMIGLDHKFIFRIAIKITKQLQIIAKILDKFS